MINIAGSIISLFLAAQPMAEEKHELRVGVRANSVLNDDFKFKITTVQPNLFYRYTSPTAFRASTLIGVLYNRIDLAQALSPAWSVMTGVETFITIAGDDPPRIDGKDQSDYEFMAHRFPFYVGTQWSSQDPSLPFEVRGLWEIDYLKTYDDSKSINFVKPSFNFEMGPLVRIRWGSGGGSEVSDKGDRLLMVSSYRFRMGNDPWGAATFLRDVDHYFKGSVGFVTNQALTEDLWIVAKAQASFVSEADRLNAIKSMNYHQESEGFGTSDERAERAASGELGFRYYFTPDLVVKPFGHGVIYREITPTGFRNNGGAGAGLKLAGRHWDTFSWELQYANLFGTRDDKTVLHHMRVGLSYQFM